MSIKKRALKSVVDNKIKALNIIFRFLIVFMSVIVLYDAFIYGTPLYYILFFFSGALIGKIYLKIYSVKQNEETGKFNLNSGILNIILTLVLISLRFIFGKQILDSLEFQYTSDALYLFFIGLYRSKWNAIVYHLENKLFSGFKNNTSN